MELLSLNNKISILPATEEPVLSADVVFVKAPKCTLIFDTGACDEALAAIEEVEGPRFFVISHFHKDHMGNLSKITLREQDRVYCGSFTAKKASGFITAQQLITVTEPIEITDDITIFPIPSSHAKDCLGLRVLDIAFLGDASYMTSRGDMPVYNVSLLHQTIDLLKKLPAALFYPSHTAKGPIAKDSIITDLEHIYSLRKPGEAYIELAEIHF